MNFKHEIMEYELSDLDKESIMKKGLNSVMLTAVHTMEQDKFNGIKISELFTKSITQYVANKTNSSYFIKLKDDGFDSNSLDDDKFKNELLKYIKENNIKLLIDIHGANHHHDFDVEIGTLNNLSADYSTIKELESSFKNYGIKNIKVNDPYKGGGITQFIYSNTKTDVIQIEINGKFRNIEDFESMENICNSIIDFINTYNK